MTPETAPDVRIREVLAMAAPGTAMRDGLERILRGRTGALIVLGSDRSVHQVANGGFALDIEFSATRPRELSKMDGAIIVDGNEQSIMRAAVQLMPDPNLPTEETGTRHRTADRISRQTGHPVISVSKSMNTVAVYVDGRRSTARSLHWRSRTWPPFAMPALSPRGSTWCGASIARWRITSSSWAPRAACSRCS